MARATMGWWSTPRAGSTWRRQKRSAPTCAPSAMSCRCSTAVPTSRRCASDAWPRPGCPRPFSPPGGTHRRRSRRNSGATPMADEALLQDYAQAGFGGRLAFGRSPALLIIDAVEAYVRPGALLYADQGAALDSLIRLADA